MKKYILGLSLILLILACSKTQEEINNQFKTTDPKNIPKILYDLAGEKNLVEAKARIQELETQLRAQQLRLEEISLELSKSKQVNNPSPSSTPLVVADHKKAAVLPVLEAVEEEGVPCEAYQSSQREFGIELGDKFSKPGSTKEVNGGLGQRVGEVDVSQSIVIQVATVQGVVDASVTGTQYVPFGSPEISSVVCTGLVFQE